MSDWSTAWQAAREGLTAGAQMFRQNEARKKQEELDNARLQLEKDRAEREAKEAQLRNDALTRRLNRPTPVTPDGMEVAEMSYDEYGNPSPKFRPTIKAPQSVKIGGRDVIYAPNTGQFDLVKPDPMDQYMKLFGSPSGAPSPSTLPGPVKTSGSPSTMPAPGLALSSLTPSGPAFKPFYPTSAPKPTVVKDANGSEYTVWVTTNPETGQTEYSKPEKASTVSAGGQEKLNTTLNAFDNLGSVAQHVSKYGDAGGPLASKAGGLFTWLTGPSDARREFGTDVAKNLAPLAKGILGETGTLTADDAQRYLPLIPNFEDTRSARISKIQGLRDMLISSAKNQLEVMKANGIDTKPYEEQVKAKLQSIPTVVESEEQYAALPAGALYMDSNGQIARKPAAP
jgi:hypothetical protein